MQIERFLKQTVQKLHKKENIDLEDFEQIESQVLEKVKHEFKGKVKEYQIQEKDIPSTYPDEEKLEKIEKYCVLFSGGCDSLSLALRHLEKGDNVALCHIVFNKEESIAAYLLYQLLKEIYGRKVLGFFRLFSPVYISYCEDSVGWGQQPITAFYASWIPRCLKKNCKAIESAYIMNDDAISYEKELKSIYSNSVALKAYDDKMPPYNFPLKKYKHEDNQHLIGELETKYGVKFPCSSAEYCMMKTYKMQKDGYTQYLHFYKCDTDSKKENKINDVFCYIILEDPTLENCVALKETVESSTGKNQKTKQLEIDFNTEQ